MEKGGEWDKEKGLERERRLGEGQICRERQRERKRQRQDIGKER